MRVSEGNTILDTQNTLVGRTCLKLVAGCKLHIGGLNMGKGIEFGVQDFFYSR